MSAAGVAFWRSEGKTVDEVTRAMFRASIMGGATMCSVNMLRLPSPPFPTLPLAILFPFALSSLSPHPPLSSSTHARMYARTNERTHTHTRTRTVLCPSIHIHACAHASPSLSCSAPLPPSLVSRGHRNELRIPRGLHSSRIPPQPPRQMVPIASKPKPPAQRVNHSPRKFLSDPNLVNFASLGQRMELLPRLNPRP